MKLPSEILQISPWRAYQGRLDDFTGGHRIIIIYPHDKDNYCYLMVTSKVEKAKLRSKNDIASLVELETKDWDELTCHSCIECSKRNMKIVNVQSLKNLYEKESLKPLSVVPDIVKTKIIAGICSSTTYTEKEKALYTKY